MVFLLATSGSKPFTIFGADEDEIVRVSPLRFFRNGIGGDRETCLQRDRNFPLDSMPLTPPLTRNDSLQEMGIHLSLEWTAF
ncbi:MAG: hypothetical protein AB4042_13650 [Leptolyngbyaceae cyanobacterium]